MVVVAGSLSACTSSMVGGGTGSGGAMSSSGSGGSTMTGTGGAAGGSGGTTAGTGGAASGTGTGGASDAGAGGSDAAAGGGDAAGGSMTTSLGPAGGACPGGPYPAPIPQNNKATLVRGAFGGQLEGAVWVAAQKALYFCVYNGGVMNGQIQKYTPADGQFTIFANNIGVGGLAMGPDGMLVAASYDKRALTRFDPATGTRTDVPGFTGKNFNEVNDVVVRSDGNMYFSDPQFGPNQQGLPMAFYRLSPPPASAITSIVMARNANGIALAPDGLSLYMSTTDGGPALMRVPLGMDGAPSGPVVTLKDATSDGMGVDCAGNVYLSGQTDQINVISPTDQAVGTIVGTGGYVTNSAFGDEDRKTLYITTFTSLYKIQLDVPGFPN
ncbi:MAG TPA: SMP-30/gluconolactonase/LRE family protein [Polyangia bacterium]|nr:SMP-30/gluconolactonase/LRE family protein [Polyangia bacterium]